MEPRNKVVLNIEPWITQEFFCPPLLSKAAASKRPYLVRTSSLFPPGPGVVPLGQLEGVAPGNDVLLAGNGAYGDG